MKNLSNFRKACVLSVISIILLSCKTEKMEPLIESRKDLTGSWVVTRVLQNSNDITENLELNEFKLVFEAGNYSFVNQNIPFIVDGDGQWAFNDPQFPFSINFTPANGEAKHSKIDFPITGSARELTLTFDLGCYRNVYQFTLRPENK